MVRFKLAHFTRNYLSDQTEKRVPCMGDKRNRTTVLMEKPEQNTWKNPGVDGRIILKRILKKLDERAP
jgi:hypothetical protein